MERNRPVLSIAALRTSGGDSAAAHLTGASRATCRRPPPALPSLAAAASFGDCVEGRGSGGGAKWATQRRREARLRGALRTHPTAAQALRSPGASSRRARSRKARCAQSAAARFARCAAVARPCCDERPRGWHRRLRSRSTKRTAANLPAAALDSPRRPHQCASSARAAGHIARSPGAPRPRGGHSEADTAPTAPPR
eukprot:scaffold2668_cov115-Isochrysis_galbana.AAC.12